jgi:osmotically inducible lipoprotein OsmB
MYEVWVNELVRMCRSRPMKRLTLPVIIVVMLSLAGCAGMSETQQRTLTGGAAGAAGGAVIGAIAGNAGLGAAIGGATGLAGGYLYGKHADSNKQAYEQGVADGRTQQSSGSR